jgi:Transposase DNA-binding
MDVVAGKRLSFGELHFGSARLGDARRTRRLVKIADRIMEHPGGSLPQKMSGWAELMGLYRLVEADEVTHDAMLQTHCQRTRELAEQAGGVILRLHDTTELDYTHVPALHEQLGPLGDGSGLGYLCHNVLAVTPAREVLGLCAQRLHKRRKVPASETGLQKRAHPQRESLLWLKGLDAATGAPGSTAQWIEIADRGADTFEFLAHLHRRGCRYVIRCARDRALSGEDHVAVDRIHAHLLAYTRDLPTLGTCTVEVKRQQKTRRKPLRKARVATVRIAAGPVTLAPPHWACGDYTPQPLSLWVTHVLELQPPSGEAALEWILLSNVATESFAAACERVDWYGCRPMVEELHKAMKTGCGIEQMQFEHADRLEPMIALLSVVAAVLLQLRQAARRADADTTPATTLLPRMFVQVLCGWRYKDPKRPMSVLEFTMALARLGGHLNRKGDGFPGWLTLWRGWEALRMMVMGAQAMYGEKCV